MAKLIKQPHGGAINRQEKGDPSPNPHGRPPKLLTRILRDLKKQGYEEIKPSHIREAYQILLGLDEEGIKKMMKDKSTPMLLRIVGKEMLSKKGVSMIEKMLDRAHGKPQQFVDHTTDGKEINTVPKHIKDLVDKFCEQKEKDTQDD